MLSYQHIYHAGCLADLHKHIALAALFANATEQRQNLFYIDTHSGRGVYNLLDKEARKTGESNFGIKKFLVRHNFHPTTKIYLRTVKAVMLRYGKSYYPGSPQIASVLLRPTDIINCIELHPREYQLLVNFAQNNNVNHHYGDGYLLARKLAESSRGKIIVFIDPSYEIKTEYLDCARFIVNFSQKFPTATVLCWAPALSSRLCDKIPALLRDRLPNDLVWQQEIPISTPHKIQGSLLIGVNIPISLQDVLATLPDIMLEMQK